MTTTNIIKFSLREWKMIHMHTHTLWHVEVCKLYALQHCQTSCTKKLRSTKPTATPRTCVRLPVTFQSKDTQNMTCTSCVQLQLQKKRKKKKRWLWGCCDSIVNRRRLLKPGYSTLPACCVMDRFLQSRLWNGWFLTLHMQRTSSSTRWGFHSPIWQILLMLLMTKMYRHNKDFPQKKKKSPSIWNLFGPYYSRFLDRCNCAMCQSSTEVCSSFSAHLWPKSQEA